MSIHSQAFLGGYTHLFIGITVLFGVKRSAETVLGFSRETKSIGNIYMCVCMCIYIYIPNICIYYKELNLAIWSLKSPKI